MKLHYLEKIIFSALSVILFFGLIFVIVKYPAERIGSKESQDATVTANRNTNPSGSGALVNTVTKNDDSTLEISLPEMNSSIASPVTVYGKAKGWYFEGSFPIKILDDKGSVLGQGIATAQGDWMTEDFVEFKAQIIFKSTKSLTGAIKFIKDNPSGLKENDKEFTLPIKFNQSITEQPKGTCKPDLASCAGNAELCLEQNLNKVCS